MTTERTQSPGPIRGCFVLAAMIAGLTACQASQNSNSCAFVELEHLARPFDGAGKTLICSPKRVSAAYRDRYFPGYSWGDETW